MNVPTCECTHLWMYPRETLETLHKPRLMEVAHVSRHVQGQTTSWLSEAHKDEDTCQRASRHCRLLRQWGNLLSLLHHLMFRLCFSPGFCCCCGHSILYVFICIISCTQLCHYQMIQLDITWPYIHLVPVKTEIIRKEPWSIWLVLNNTFE